MNRPLSRFLLAASMLSTPFVALPQVSHPASAYAGSEQDRASLQKTGQTIRDGFARGDIETIMLCHHPDVIKALSYDRYLVGRSAVRDDILKTLQAFHLAFEQNQIESTFFQGDTAVEQSLFTIKGTPINGGAPFLFKGRSIVVYVRYKQSPTGWASIREVIQPAP
jgi:ketosteroid isomerase-like protein